MIGHDVTQTGQLGLGLVLVQESLVPIFFYFITELFFSHNVKMNSYDDLEDADRQDSNEQIDRSTLFQFKTPGNSYELR